MNFVEKIKFAYENYNNKEAAKFLNMSEASLYRYVRKYGIQMKGSGNCTRGTRKGRKTIEEGER